MKIGLGTRRISPPVVENKPCKLAPSAPARPTATAVPNLRARSRHGEPSVNSYDLAVAALMALKGERVIDVVGDGRVISLLMTISPHVTRKLIKEHWQRKLGYPTMETIEVLLAELEEQSFGVDTDSF